MCVDWQEPYVAPSAPSAEGLGGLPNARSGIPRHPGMLRGKTGEATARCPSCAGTWQEPRVARKGRVRYYQWPLGVLKAVLGLAVSERGTCQYPFVRSSVDIYRVLPRRSRSSSTRGIG